MKKSFLIIGLFFSLSIFSCKKDDAVTCTFCTSPQTTTNFEVCKEGDGNASVSGENTGTPYDVYMSGLREAGAQCGQ